MRNHIFPLLAVALAQAICASAAGPSTPITFGETLTGSIVASGEVDTYTFSAAVGDRVLVSMAVASGAMTPEIRLYNPAGQLICSAYSYAGSAAGFEDCSLSVAGTYTLLANDYGLTDTGSYGLHLQRLNNPGNATALAFGQTLQATIGAVGEKDAYTFAASVGDRVLVSMAVASGAMTPEIRLYNPAGQLICSAYSYAGSAAGFEDCSLSVAGIYTLLTNDYGLTDTGSYGLHLQRLNNPGNATALAFGQTLQATIGAVGEKDAYTFSAGVGDRVLVSMAVASGAMTPEIRLYNPAGQLICAAYSYAGSAAGFEDCSLSVAGTYTLLTNDYGLTDTGSYGLHLQRLNNPGNATALAFGQTLQATIGVVGEKDAYTFSAGVGDRVLVSMAVASSAMTPEIRLYNPAGQPICSAYSYAGSAAGFDDCSLPMAGTYTLLANDYGLTDKGSYSLHLSRGGCTLTCAANVPAEGNVGTSVAFSVAAPPPSCGTPVTYHWNFGDGTNSSAQTPTHTYTAEGTFQWTLAITAGGQPCNRSGSVRILAPGTEPSETVFFDGFDTYAAGSALGGQGGWVNRWGGGITASAAQSVSPPQSCRMDNSSGCFESQLYHPLPYLDVLWFSADIMGVPTGRTGCHEFDAMVRLFNPSQGAGGGTPVAFALRSGGGEFNVSPGLAVETGLQDFVSLEPDYNSLVNRWIHVEAKVDHPRRRVDVWVDGEYRGFLTMDPAAAPYTGIAVDAGEGRGFVDNIRVSKNGPEPGDTAVALTLGVPLPTTIRANRYRFFKVTSRPNLDLLVTIDQTGSLGGLELYGSAGAPPSRDHYDAYDGTQTGTAHQALVFPATREPQTYYFLVYDKGGPASAPFTILARHPGFHLDRVNPSVVSNAGNATLTLVGSGLSPATQVRLISPSGGAVAALGTQFVSSVRLHATFAFVGVATGLYNVRIDDPVGGTSTLSHGLEVRGGDAGALVATLNAPANVRPDRNYTVWVEYGNRGGTDIHAPLFIVSSPQNLPMRLASSEPFRQGPIQVLGVNMNGPVGVLTPGSRFSIPIEFRSSTPGNQIQFNLEVMGANATPVNWTTVEAEIRPPGIADDAWNAIRSSLRTRVGTTWADYLSTLTAASSYLADHYHEAAGALDPSEVTPQGRLPVPVYSVRELFGFELAKASGSISPHPVLAAGLDAFYPEPGLPLAFLRIAPSPIEQRFRFGTLGRGWAHNYEYSVRADSDGSVAVREPGGQERLFLSTGNGALSAAAAAEHATLTRAGQGYTLRERDGFVLGFVANRLAYLEDTNGNRLTLGYTSNALTSITHSNGDHLTIHYNASGRIERVSDPAGRTTSYRYDGAGEHLLEVEEAGGPTTTYVYHPIEGSPAAHALSAITFPGGTHRYFGWDNIGRLTGEWRDGEAERQTYSYDTQGTITVDNEASDSLVQRFGHRGQLLSSEDSEDHQLALSYDPTRNPTRLQDALGSPAMLIYDSHGNPLGLRDLAGGVTRLTYGSLDRLASLRDERENITGFGYDAKGNLKSMEYPDRSHEAYDVDTAGDLVAYTNRRQQIIHYDRNAKGQIIHRRFPGGVTVNYTYDASGNLDTIADATGTTNLDYDDRDFLTRISYPDGRFLAFQYDDSGRRTSRTDETGFTLRYEYDAAGRLARLRDTAGSQLIVYQYDAAGRLAREERGNGTSTTYEYDSAGQILHLIHYAPNGSIQSRFDYTYDERGNPTSMTTLAGMTTYKYDTLGQLVGVTYPNASTTTYEYDAVGNRVVMTENGETQIYHTNELNQYIAASGVTFTYDEDGNLTSRADSSGTTSYEYDQENRMVRVTKPSDGTWLYTYDSLGNRVAVNHNGAMTRYAHDPIGLVDVVAEYDGSGHLKARYIHGLGLVARIDALGNPAYYGFDAVGSSRHLTSGTGTVVNSYDYDPWGIPLAASEGVSNPFRYVGRFGVMDDGNGTDFMRARFYDPKLGRFTSEDPLGPGNANQNLYSYAGNQPTRFVDPDGKIFLPAAVLVWIVAGAAEGGVIGGAAGFLEGLATAHYNEGSGHVLLHLGKSTLGGAINGAAWGAFVGPMGGVSYIGRGWVVTALKNPSRWKIQRAWVEKLLKWPPFVKWIGHILEATTAGWIFPHEAEAPGVPRTVAATTSLGIIRSIDPNEKTGPGPIVHLGERATYTIYFENRANATAPAQEVFITDNLDSDLDWSTFQLGEVAFGNVIVNSLAGRAQGADRITYGDDSVAIEATQSSGGGQVNWVLRTLDPNTGQLPEDPLAGFLPPEDGTGRGQGHVTFSVQVRADARRGTQVTNSASIVFDTNPAISTNTWTSTVQAAAVECGPMSLCLRDDRFRVDVSWRDFQGHTGGGTPHPISGESGYFTFFNEANAEIFIKVLDACALNGSFWVFDTHLSNVEYTITVTDRQTGQTRTLFNPLQTIAPSVLGTNTIFRECGSGGGNGLPTSERVDTSQLPPNARPIVQETVNPSVMGPCVEDTHTMCLNHGRFRVHGTFADFQGQGGVAKQWSLTSDSGYSTFFSDSNVELFLKVLDACAGYGRYWVFAGGLTNVKADLYVEDTRTGKVWHASNPSGQVFATALDTSTFFTDCN